MWLYMLSIYTRNITKLFTSIDFQHGFGLTHGKFPHVIGIEIDTPLSQILTHKQK